MPEVCVNYLSHSGCPAGEACSAIHHNSTYQWQVQHEPNGQWNVLHEEGPLLEEAYCDCADNIGPLQTFVTCNDGGKELANVCIDFTNMQAKVSLQSPGSLPTVFPVRRVSTPSYVTREVDSSGAVSANYHTQWRWYWEKNGDWIQFDSSIQSVFEKKYLHGQEVYRFETNVNCGASTLQASHTFLLDFKSMSLTNISIAGNPKCRLKRRPLLYTGAGQLPTIEVKEHPFAREVPENWVPVDHTQDYELVPLNPQSMEYHLVASEFIRSIPQGRTICDVFRLQNPFLWHKFVSKKKFMELKGVNCNERQLFHGTPDEVSVQAICKQNFDWRLCGKNNVVYGRGSYFAKNASYSDKYSSIRCNGTRWMFLARVLVGRYVKGNSSFVRPPPLDPSKAHGDLYDSCVDSVTSPAVHVIFDCDQCYPEYLISYRVPL